MIPNLRIEEFTIQELKDTVLIIEIVILCLLIL
jgi:hypothetical protein